MSRAIATLLALVVLVATAIPVAATEESEPPVTDGSAVVPGEVVVKWRDADRGDEVAEAHGLAVVAELGTTEEGMPELVSTEGRAVETVLAELASDPAVEYAEPNYVVQLAVDEGATAVAVNDPKTGPQYSLDRMRVRDAWGITRGSSRVVAVLDTGVELGHPDLAGRLVAGYDFVNNDATASDDNGHGTWVAGIIGANPNDGIGIAGISWSDRIMPVKIMNASGTGNTSDLTSGIVWAADHGAKIINMSVGGFPYSTYVHDAIRYAWNKGVVLIGAAGNRRTYEPFFPASYPEVVSVAATQVDDEFSNFSNYHADVDVSAPGASVLTTNCAACKPIEQDLSGDHRYTYISGTSFAAPNVAGVVALIWARYSTMTNAQVVAHLKATVDDRGYSGWDARYGHGRVNALRAVGGSPAGLPLVGGDALEGNNTLATARAIAIDATVRPNLYPAGDVDVFAVDVPRAGRLDVTVTGVVDNRAWPWNNSSLPNDPVVELYSAAGALLVRVDREWEGGTEVAAVSVGGPTRILARVYNFYANGTRGAYSITPRYVDTVAPSATITHPGAGATGISRFADVRATFNEPVTNVTSSTLLLRDTTNNGLVPAAVSYNSSSQVAQLSPTTRLEASRQYRVEVTTGIRDLAGNAVNATSQTFTTGLVGFIDTVGNAFAADIDWLALQGITSGCTDVRFCPKDAVSREQMASFLARAMHLPAATVDHFTDDENSGHEENINRVATAGITQGCAPARYCPKASVNREQMASFLARALSLPATAQDYFTDDEQSAHEADINRVAAAGITLGCGGTSYCPTSVVTREQMAAFLHRAFD